MQKKLIWIIDDDFIYQTIIKKLIQKTGILSAHSSFSNMRSGQSCPILFYWILICQLWMGGNLWRKLKK